MRFTSLLIKELITRMEHEQRGSVRLTPAAITALSNYPWPGNVRELSNLMERLIIMYPYGVVDERDLPEKFRGHVPAPPAREPGSGGSRREAGTTFSPPRRRRCRTPAAAGRRCRG